MLNKREFCEATIKYMDEHIETCTATDISVALEYSERVFLRKFREYYGVPFMTFLKKMQLHRAASEICKNNRVLHVRKLTGFSTPQSFSKAFKREFGVAPRQFLDTDKHIPDLEVQYRINDSIVEVSYQDGGVDDHLKEEDTSLFRPHYAVFAVENRGVSN